MHFCCKFECTKIGRATRVKCNAPLQKVWSCIRYQSSTRLARKTIRFCSIQCKDGYSFICLIVNRLPLQNVENAKKALEDATDKILDSRHIRVEQARVNRTLFIAKFDKELTKEGFRDMVEVYGKADEVSLLHNFQTGKSRGCGFVKYKYREDAIRGFTVLTSFLVF